MSFVLSGLSSLFGLLGGGAQLGSIQAAGQAQQQQAAQMLRQNFVLNQQTGKELNDASNIALSANTQAGKYSFLQNAQTALYDTHFKVASKWMQVLGGQG